jgi:hypothetical protein
MNSKELKELFEIVHKVFPVPNEEDFKGTHAFVINRKTGLLQLEVWVYIPDYKGSGSKVRCYMLNFDGEKEEISEQLLMNTRTEIIEFEKKRV